MPPEDAPNVEQGQKLTLGQALEGLFDGDPDGLVFARRLSEFVMALTNARSVVVFDDEIAEEPIVTLGPPPSLETEREIARKGLQANGVMVMPAGRFTVVVEGHDGTHYVLTVTLPPGNNVLASLAYERLEMIRALCAMWAKGQAGSLPTALLNDAAAVASGRWDAASRFADSMAAQTRSTCALLRVSKRRVVDLVISGQEAVDPRAPIRAEYEQRFRSALLGAEEENKVVLLGGRRATHALVLEGTNNAGSLIPAIKSIFDAAVPAKPPAVKAKSLLRYSLVVAAIVGAGMVPVDDNINLPATVVATSERIVTVPFDGRLEEILVKEGEIVTAGQSLLLVMDTGRLMVELAEARKALSSAITRKDNARGRGRAADFKEAEIEVERAKLQIEALDQKIASARITAPISGVVRGEAIASTPGSYMGLGTEVLRVIDPNELRLHIEVSPRARGQLNVGAAGSFRPDAAPSQAFDLDINSIAVAPNESDGQTNYMARSTDLVQSQEFQLKPGMQGAVHFDLQTLPLAELLWQRLRDWALLTFWL